MAQSRIRRSFISINTLEESGAVSDNDDVLFDLPTDEGIGNSYGLVEIPGGIGIDSCASDNVMHRDMLPGYKVRPSAGSRRGQQWGSASGHGIKNEGEVTYDLMTEHGDLSRGTTQIGKVRRPLAAVSNMTKRAKKIVLFCENDDWAIDRKDPIAAQIMELVAKAKLKTKIHEHRGTYRMRAWLIPEGPAGDKIIAKASPLSGREARAP